MLHWLYLRIGLWCLSRLFSVVSIWVPNEKDDLIRVVMFADDEFWIEQYKEHLTKSE